MDYRLGPIRVDSKRLVITRGRRALPVAPKVVETLAVLCEHRGEFVSKEAMMEYLWPGGAVDDTVLWQNVSLARKVLRPYVGADAIETLPRRGYRLRPEVPGARQRNRPAVFAIAVCGAVVMMLLGGSTLQSAPHRPPPLSGEVLRSYNLAAHYLAMRSERDLGRAEQLFQRTIRLAPDNAMGYAGMADALGVAAAYDPRPTSSAPLLVRAYRYARNAVEREPESAPAHTSLAHTEYALAIHGPHGISRSDYTLAATRDFRTAIALDDSYAPAHLWYGQMLVDEGELYSGYRELNRAVDLDPALGVANVSLAVTEYLMGHTAAATKHASDALAFGARNASTALEILASAYARERQYRIALAYANRMVRYQPALGLTERAYIEAELKQKRTARSDLSGALRLGPCACVEYWLNIALTQKALGDTSAALRSLHKAPPIPFERMLVTYDSRFKPLSRKAATRSS